MVRTTDDLLADMDNLLAEVDAEKFPDPVAIPAPASAPVEEPAATEWEEVTAPRPPRQRTKKIARHSRYGYGTDALTRDDPAEFVEQAEEPDVAPGVPESGEPTTARTPPVIPLRVRRAKSLKSPDHHDDDHDDDQGGDEQDDGEEGDALRPSRRQVVISTVREWRPPAGPRGKAWSRAAIFTGSGALLCALTGTTRQVYDALNSISIAVDAVAGIALAAALALLMITRSPRALIGLGIALGLVLLLAYMTVPVAAGALATGVTWGLDQRARTMRPVVAWAVRTSFSTVAIATFALVWTPVVHYLTGAAQ